MHVAYTTRRSGLSRPSPTKSPIMQPTTSAHAVISTVTQAPGKSCGQPAHTGEKSNSTHEPP